MVRMVAGLRATDKPAQPAEAPPSDVAKPQPAVTENSLAETSVPFVLSVRGPDVLPDAGDIELTAKITAPREFKVPGTLSITLPAGARLASGNASEALASIPAGETQRTFKVTLSGKLGAGNQIRFVLDARDPGGSMGAHAVQLFPEVKATSTSTRTTPNAPPPPVGRPAGKAPPH